MTHAIECMCRLCQLPLPPIPVVDQGNGFCCTGCHAVFNILSARQQLDRCQEHPLFQQALRSGLISNPALLETSIEKKETDGSSIDKLHFEVLDMWCPSCAEVIRLVLMQEKGVRRCVIDYATDLAMIEFTPRIIGRESLIAIVHSLGYKTASLENREKKEISFALYLRFIVAAFFSLNIMMFAYPLYATYFDAEEQGVGRLFAWLSFWAALPVLTYSAWPIARRAWTSLLVGLPGMELLVMIGVCSAFGLSFYELLQGGDRVYFDSMTVIITFVLLGKIIETKAKFSAQDSLFRLNRALPRRGRKRFESGECCFVSIKDLAVGDTIVAYAGERIILDGIVKEGHGMCDESLMTGEALPVFKEINASVLGGTILQSGWIAYQMTVTAEASALQLIVQMIERDIGGKSQYVRAADRIVRWFVPMIVAIAFAAGAAVWMMGLEDKGLSVQQTAMIRMVSILLISCPCAIGIAAPLAESYLMQQLSACGVIVRNRGCLAFLGKESVFVFDKTGTVTEGRFALMRGCESLTHQHMSILKALAMHSNHPIAQAISKEIMVEAAVLLNIEECIGAGMRGWHQGERYLLGSEGLLKSQGILVEVPSESIGIVSKVYFAEGARLLTQLELGDRIKPNAAEAISQLAPAKTVLLSGDAYQVVDAVSKVCGFTDYKGICTPLMKKEYIEELRSRGEIVCMVGDGINDAPALTQAQVGISVVSATDMSIQVSDLLLTHDRLDIIHRLRQLAQKGRRIIQQNLFWAFFYNIFGIGLAVFGQLSPIFAAFAMTASSLIVLLNARRMRY